MSLYEISQSSQRLLLNVDRTLFQAFAECPYKAFLQASGVPEDRDAVELLVRQRLSSGAKAAICSRQPSVRADSAQRPVQDHLQQPSLNCDSFGTSVYCELSNNRSRKNRHQLSYTPVVLTATHKTQSAQKLIAAFTALVIIKLDQPVADFGKFLHVESLATKKADLRKHMLAAQSALEQIIRMRDQAYEPPFALNPHCKACRFQRYCFEQAKKKDDLSLLSSMSPKEIQKQKKKGIFTVTQFSYTFRPRRRRRNKKSAAKHHPALKARAIREQQIYVTSSPELPKNVCRVFLDVEGIPDKNLYYLAGVKVMNDGKTQRHSFWVSDQEDEPKAWRDFLSLLASLRDFAVFHYGSYDARYLKTMFDKYGDYGLISADIVEKALVNVLTHCYLNVYFPTFSNGLKDIVEFLNYTWDEPGASGLRSIEWRYQWEATLDPEIKNRLIAYNEQDVDALHVVVDALTNIAENRKLNQTAVIASNDIKPDTSYGFRRTNFLVSEFDYINRCAYFDYQRARVYWRTDRIVRISLRRKARQQRRQVPVNKVIGFTRPKRCIACKSRRVVKHQAVARTIYDLRFNASGVKRWIVKYDTHRVICQKCNKTFYPSVYPQTRNKYGHGLLAWVVYQNIGLRQSQGNVMSGLNEVFGFSFDPAIVATIKARAAEFYQPTRQEILTSIRTGPLVHVDETKVSIKGVLGYVWVFASLHEVLYVYSECRESGILSEILGEFKGVMVSDFYPGYEAFPCLQQRCLVHLIRDLNDDLFKNPFDGELKHFVMEFGRLLKPIIATIDRYGLKRWFLSPHKKHVAKFYKNHVDKPGTSELALKYQTRFRKNRDRLFLFLEHDGVPWNNNNAENAIKGFITLRNVIGGSSTPKGLKESLDLLSIAQTLRNRNVSFLEFLRSGETSIARFLGDAGSAG